MQRGSAAVPRSPLKSPKPKIGSHLHRLYKAPQASIRGDSVPSTSTLSQGGGTSFEESSSQHLVGGAARRRRGDHRVASTQYSEGNGFSLERQSSNRSITDEFLGASDHRLLPEAPKLWSDDRERSNHVTSMHNSFPDLSKERSPLRPRRRSIRIQSGMDDNSDRVMDDFSNQGTKVYNCSSRPKPRHHPDDKHQHANPIRSWMSFTNAIQICVLLILAVFVYDSHHKAKAHRVRLREYDEERSHILEQMMWIDKAAKKVHNRYSTMLQKDPSLESREELVEETKYLRSELERVQLRIQLNARERIHQLFDEKPLHVNFKASLNNHVEDVILALSDDTPHAVATLLEQVDQKLWEDLAFEPVEPGIVQVSSLLPTSTPLLEFVERSRGCHEVGAVSLRSTIKDEITMVVLRIHLGENVPLSDKDVCIGKLLQGLDALKSL